MSSLFRIAVIGVMTLASASIAFAEDGTSGKWSPVGFGIGIPDLSAKPDFRANSLIWPESGTPVSGFDLTVLCGFRSGVKGVQIGGLVASADEMSGLCLGCADLVFNDFRGVMIGGYGAIANRSGKGAMFAGGFSFAREFDGLQLSGAVNWAQAGSVFQVGGINYAGTGSCVQIGGINYAGSAKCLQIGFINCGSEGLFCCPIVRAHW